MSKTYQINTVQDMIECTTHENINNFLEDLKSVIQIEQKLQSSYNTPKCKGFTWIDDNKNNIELKLKVY